MARSIYPIIPAPGNDLPSLQATLGAMRQSLNMLILNAQNPNPNFAPSSAAQVFVTHDQLRKLNLIGEAGPQGSKGEQGLPGPAGPPGRERRDRRDRPASPMRRTMRTRMGVMRWRGRKCWRRLAQCSLPFPPMLSMIPPQRRRGSSWAACTATAVC